MIKNSLCSFHFQFQCNTPWNQDCVTVLLQNSTRKERNILYLGINVTKMYDTLTKSCMYAVENNWQRYLLTFTSPNELQAVLLYDTCCFLQRWNPFLPNDHNSENHRVGWGDHLIHQAIPPPRFIPTSLLIPPSHPFSSSPSQVSVRADRLTGGIIATHTPGLAVSAALRTNYRTRYFKTLFLIFNLCSDLIKTEHNFEW